MEKVIVMFQMEDRVLNQDLYSFLKQYEGYKVIICNVNDEEFKNMENQVKNGFKRLYERIPKIQVRGYDNTRVLGYYDMDIKKIRFINFKTEKVDLEEEVFKNAIKVYTTESYDDIIEYYNSKNLDGIEIKEQSMPVILQKKFPPRMHRLP